MHGPGANAIPQLAQSISPSADALLARVDLLATSHQTDTGAPIAVATHQFQDQRRLRRFSVKLLLALSRIPRALSLIKNDGVLVGWLRGRGRQLLFEKVIDVLNPGTNNSPLISERGGEVPLPAPTVLILCQGFPEDGDEGSVTGGVDNVSFLLLSGCNGVVDDLNAVKRVP